jgi:hypothetical protein
VMEARDGNLGVGWPKIVDQAGNQEWVR